MLKRPNARAIRRKVRTILHDYDDDLSTVEPSEISRMDALLAEFGIPDTNPMKWWWLSYHLAKALKVPGIDPPPPKAVVKRGRKTSWSKLRLLRLWADIEVLRKRRIAKTGVEPLCERLIKNPKSRWHGEGSAVHLANMHARASKIVNASILGAPASHAKRREWVIGRYAQTPPKSNPYRIPTLLTDE